MFTLKIENPSGEILELTHNKNYVVDEFEFTSKARINLSDVAGMDGGLYNSSKSEPITGTIVLAPQFPIEQNRLNLYRYFQRGKWCRVYYSNGSIDVQIEGYVEEITPSLFSKRQTVQISIVCPKAYFEEIFESYSDISSIISTFEIPFAIEEDGVEFSYINHDVLATVINEGSVDSGVIIHITARGSIVNPIIYGNTFGGSMKFNIELQETDQLIINTNSGERSVKLIRGVTETNVVNCLGDNPTWFEVFPGENVFSYDAESGAELLSIVFRHRTKYGGI